METKNAKPQEVSLEELAYNRQSVAINNLATELIKITSELNETSTNTSKYEGLMYELRELTKIQNSLMANRDRLHVKNNYDLPGGPCGLEEC